MYKLKHCREYFMKTRAKYFIFVKYEQGDALNDLWNFLVLAYSHTLNSSVTQITTLT